MQSQSLLKEEGVSLDAYFFLSYLDRMFLGMPYILFLIAYMMIKSCFKVCTSSTHPHLVIAHIVSESIYRGMTHPIMMSEKTFYLVPEGNTLYKTSFIYFFFHLYI